ncbi:MAG: membrane-bound lytic murein transglycosylase MltF [Marinobacter sp.]|uniref:membrane-bound lytic murein transglycosylase MltF n=1 Tax=Marinobacter sp. TaxID=50741 RepID=UPI00299E248B|nr:membrane-bound lytic murein transglycosylase MltF [Marinobacter sp.]MDX1635822.1 membrane-bound lytic murein transglycosylase MltF [Marinobacter sp.]
MSTAFIRPMLAGLVLVAGAVLLTACGQGSATSSQDSATASEGPGSDKSLADPAQTGVLKVVTRNGSTTYYLNRHEQPSGPEYDLVTAYAQAQGWDVEWQMLNTTAQVLDALENGEAHLAAAGLTHLPSRNGRFERGPAHTEITQQLVCHRELRPLPNTADKLSQVRIRVTAGSSYAETLTVLAGQNEGLSFEEDAERSTETLLAQVAQGELDCTVADSNIVQVNRRFMHELNVAMNLTEGQNLGWYLPQGSEQLAQSSRNWMNGQDGDAAIGDMEERYYAYIGEFDFVDLRALNRRIDDRLPNYLEEFQAAAEQTGMPVDLLAALSYQESHWDPTAKSPTGVRGIMMLTRRTAESLGVKDRLDPAQAIDGGARYLADRHERLPESIPEPDRTFLALASYNVGRGHLLDARQLARDLGKNPDSWKDMSEVLPLLADERYYPNLRYGYARGYEPVHYVTRIRNYQDVIASAIND